LKKVWLLYLLGALCGLPIAVSFLVPWSMIPDVIDEFMINKGERKESVFYSFFVFFTKMASGVAAGASALALEVAGYKSDKCYVQPESVGFALRMVVVPVPAVMILGCMFMLWVHPIDEKKRAVIKEKLIEIRYYIIFS
jgi:Na+/melibiose symporter-like transporter